MLKVRYFAWLRQRVGHADEEVEPPPEIATVRALAAWLAERHPRFGEALAQPGVVRFALNKTYVAEDAAIRPGDEVAFFPPVTGG